MIQRLSRRLLSTACFALLLTSPLRAQSPQATISGIITDPTGAIVPGVQVTALSGLRTALNWLDLKLLKSSVCWMPLVSMYITVTLSDSGSDVRRPMW